MKVVCPGSYDPVTRGHIDIVARAARLFDQVVIAVVHNPNKNGTFSVSERLELVKAGLQEDPRTTSAGI